MTKQVDIRGTVYPSQKAAALALGVTPQAIAAAAKLGTLDNVGRGPAATRAALEKRLRELESQLESRLA